jgi:hypothetical protein
VILSRVRSTSWLLVPAVAAIMLSMVLDPLAMPFSGNERISAVFLIDGQGYFGHLEDVPWSGTITLRDVYYFADASKVTSDLPLALVKRGGELHQPIDVMHIRRDRVLLVERVGLDSAVAQAISAQRALDRSVTK